MKKLGHMAMATYLTPGGLIIVSYPVTCFVRRSEVRCRSLSKISFRVRRSGSK